VVAGAEATQAAEAVVEAVVAAVAPTSRVHAQAMV
jgi:hypothetical protein